MGSTRVERDLQAAAADLQAARNAFVRAILDARAAGLSLRQISAASGVSHETVRRLARDARVA